MNVKSLKKAFLVKVGTYKACKKRNKKFEKFHLGGKREKKKQPIFALKVSFFDNFNKIENGSKFPFKIT